MLLRCCGAGDGAACVAHACGGTRAVVAGGHSATTVANPPRSLLSPLLLLRRDREGKVVSVYRKKFVIHVERVTIDRANGAPVQAGIHPSNCQIIKPKIDADRTAMIERKAAGRQERSKHKDLKLMD